MDIVYSLISLRTLVSLKILVSLKTLFASGYFLFGVLTSLSEPILGYLVMFACLLIYRRAPELLRGLLIVVFTAEAPGWAIASQHPISFFSLFGFSRKTHSSLLPS